MPYELNTLFLTNETDSSFQRLYQDVIDIIKEEISKIKLEYKFNYKSALEEEYWDMIDLTPSSNIEIDVIFYEDEQVEERFYIPENSMGFFALTDEESDNGYNESFQVYIKINENYLLDLVRTERNNEFDPSNDRYDCEYLINILSTITHELFHVIEFVEHSNGMTPYEVDNIGMLTNEVCYGVNALKEADQVFFKNSSCEERNKIFHDLLEEKYQILYDLMEERVEKKSKDFFRCIESKIINLDSFRLALKAITDTTLSEVGMHPRL